MHKTRSPGTLISLPIYSRAIQIKLGYYQMLDSHSIGWGLCTLQSCEVLSRTSEATWNLDSFYHFVPALFLGSFTSALSSPLYLLNVVLASGEFNWRAGIELWLRWHSRIPSDSFAFAPTVIHNRQYEYG